ncbi:pseudouridine synthase family protein [Mesomycoplasma dispar]|uniref:RNA pseudouridylate synthase n=1 Tax=Mesomycoplasma dispar TaxID=86660 RepID=A0ABN5DQK0_9BACT|nr:RluA family pseudouridine synthase [Mesomycoplasma dispar]ATP59375.1 RNA pseudouridine synthase [Mesomycoplasma dispar]
MIKFVATKDQDGQKLIQLVKKILLNFSYNEIQKYFRNKKIKVNNVVQLKNYCIKEGDIVLIFVDEKKDKIEKKLLKFSINLKIIYKDSNILIIDKPENLQVHGGAFNLDLAVWNYLKIPENQIFMPSHIGRLDKKTSGIILYGLNYQSVVELNKKQNFFEKIYTFESEINLKKSIKTDLFVGKNDLIKKMEVVPKSLKSTLVSTTFYSKNHKKFAILHTGKKHQIRVSLSHLGFPILGDEKYGGLKAKRLFLHSFSLKFSNLEGFLSYLNDKKFTSKPEWW